MPSSTRRRLAVACALAVGMAAACSKAAPHADAWSLFARLGRIRRLEVIAPDAACESIVRIPITLRAMHAGFEVTFARPGGRPRDSARVWIGDLRTPGLDPLLARLSVERREQGGFRYLDVDYPGPRDALMATFDDPERPGLPITMFLAGTAEGAARLARCYAPCARPSFRTWLDGAVDREGQLEADGDARRDTVLVFSEARARVFAKEESVDLGGFELISAGDFSRDAQRDWIARVDAARQRAFEMLLGEGAQAAHAKPRLRVYTHPEDKVRLTRNGALSSQNPLTDEVETVLAPGMVDDGGYGLARAQARAMRGDPGQAWMLDGVAAACVQTWWGRPMDAWLAHLVSGQLVPPVAEILEPESEHSPHLLIPLRGALVRFALERHGPDAMNAAWSAPAEGPIDPALYADFPAWLERTVEPYMEAARSSRTARQAAAIGRPFRKGVNLCAAINELDPLADGFGSRDCEASTARVRSLGANALAINWNVFLDRGPPAFACDGACEGLAASAPDLALVATALHAHRVGLELMFKPQLITNRSGTWAGAALLTTEQNQARLFEGLRRFAVHAGLLGELSGADILCIGSEIPEATKTSESERNHREWSFLEARRDAWTSVFSGARGAFGGAVTYAARWDSEAGSIEFWKSAQYVAQNLYGTLAGTRDRERPPRPAEIGTRLAWYFQKLAELSQERGRPALVTEIGCASTSESWRDPSTAPGVTDVEAQRRYYEGVDEALRTAREQFPELKGVYFWNWTTDPRAGGSADRHFSPQNKPAEAVLARFFARP